jgi:hypothetical protein
MCRFVAYPKNFLPYPFGPSLRTKPRGRRPPSMGTEADFLG